jgi:hypothetical protein
VQGTILVVRPEAGGQGSVSDIVCLMRFAVY